MRSSASAASGGFSLLRLQDFRNADRFCLADPIDFSPAQDPVFVSAIRMKAGVFLLNIAAFLPV